MNRVKLPVSMKRENPFVMSRPGTMFGISDDSMTKRSVRTPPFTKMYTKMCHAATASANTTAVSTAVNTMCAAMVDLRSIFLIPSVDVHPTQRTDDNRGQRSHSY